MAPPRPCRGSTAAAAIGSAGTALGRRVLLVAAAGLGLALLGGVAAEGAPGDAATPDGASSLASSAGHASSGGTGAAVGEVDASNATNASNGTLHAGMRRRAIPPTFCNMGNQSALAIGDQVYLCVFLSTSPPKKMVFRITVEEYAELKLQGSQARALDNQSMPIYTWVATSHQEPAAPLDCTGSGGDDFRRRKGRASCPQVYATSTHVAHLLNLVINMRDGAISSFAWDNGCRGCGPDACMESSRRLDLLTGEHSSQMFSPACGAELTGCSANGLACDMKILVTWAGTDREGRHATTAGMRLSKFSGYTLASLYEKANKQYEAVTSR